MPTTPLMDFTQLGVAGILILMVLDKAFSFVRSMRNGKNGSAGAQPIEFWRNELKITTENSLAPHVRSMVDAVERLNQIQQEIQKGIIELVVLARQQSGRMNL